MTLPTEAAMITRRKSLGISMAILSSSSFLVAQRVQQGRKRHRRPSPVIRPDQAASEIRKKLSPRARPTYLDFRLKLRLGSLGKPFGSRWRRELPPVA